MLFLCQSCKGSKLVSSAQMMKLSPLIRVPETQTLSPSPSISESMCALQWWWALDQPFAQRLLQLFQSNLCQRRCWRGMNIVLWPDSELEVTGPIVILVCHRHAENCITRSWFWFFPSLLSKVFSLHEAGWVQTLLFLSVQKLPVTISWPRSAQSSGKAVWILSLENKNQYSCEFYFIF